MKKGDHFFLSLGEDQVYLMCKAQDFTENGIEFWVVNGCWYGYFKDGVVKIPDPSGGWVRKPIEGMAISYTGYIPPNEGYNECMYFVRKVKSLPYLLQKPYVIYHQIRNYPFKTKINRFKKATKAFKKIMKDGWYEDNITI